ncbi:19640_t:CDS:2, partial [Dentiscutata erythropus]
MNLMFIYMNVEEEEGSSIKDVDKSDGLMEQKMEIGGDVISKNVSNNESKAFKEDPKPDVPRHGISLINIFWDNIRNGDTSQVGLEKENAEKNDIESNESIAEVDQLLSDMKNGNSEFADIWCDNGTYNVGYCEWDEMTGDEKDEHKKFVCCKVDDLIDFDESDQMNEREPESIFDTFIGNDLIDFRCVAEESVKNDEGKNEIIWESDGNMLRRIGDKNNVEK